MAVEACAAGKKLHAVVSDVNVLTTHTRVQNDILVSGSKHSCQRFYLVARKGLHALMYVCALARSRILTARTR